MADYYLIHEGVSKLDGAPGRGSGRYPLGSGKRPYQGKPQEVALSKKELRRDRRAARAEAKKAKPNAEPKPEAPKKTLSAEEKQAIIDKGDLKTAFANRDQFSNADIDAVILRHDKVKKLNDMANPKKEPTLDKLDRTVARGQRYVENLVKAYNTLAPVSNTFFKTKLPKIQFSADNGKKKKEGGEGAGAA